MLITTSTGYWRLATKSFFARTEGASYIGVPFSAIERNSPAVADHANASRTEAARPRISGQSRYAVRWAARRLRRRAVDDIGNGLARVGKQHVRANYTEHRGEVRIGDVADLKHARLRGLHQEQGLVAAFCAHRDDQSHLEQELVHALRLLRD